MKPPTDTLGYDDGTIADRERLLNEYSEAYYNGQPVVSDAEFDRLWREHQHARNEDPNHAQWRDTILDRVGAKPTSGFRKVKHATKMMSLDNLFVDDDGHVSQLDKWLQGICAELGEGTLIMAEPKIDGLSMSVVYENGILAQAVTRGDGFEGDDVTDNARVAGFVPSTIIPDAPWNGAGTFEDPRGRYEFRGEVFLTFDAFAELNHRAETAGEETYSNPRNAAAGLIRRKDPASLQGCGLQFLCHGYQNPKMDRYDFEATLWDKLGITPANGLLFQAASTPPVDTLRKLMQQAYPTDGVVFKVVHLEQRKALGETSRAPRWAIALKFEQEQVETTLEAITVQVGRSGVLTPVAELTPVEVDGSVVSRATLHNEDQINRLHLQVGDRVLIQKAGGIIPEIVKSVTHEQRFDEIRRGLDRDLGHVIHPNNLDGEAIKPLHRERPAFNLLRYVDQKCPSCGTEDLLVSGTITDSMVAAEFKRKYDFDAGSDAKVTNLGNVKREMRKTIAGLSEETITQLRLDNGYDDKTNDEMRKLWLEEVTISITGTGLRYACGNPTCPAKLAARIEHMASRGCLNIDQLGGEAAEAIAAGNGAGGPPMYPFELLTKMAPWFARIEWTTESGGKMTLGESRAKKIRAGIDSAFKLPLSRWIAACGIPSVGQNTSKELTRIFKQPIDFVRQYMDSDGAHDVLKQIAAGADKTKGWLAAYKISHHLGPVSAQSMLDFIGSPEGAYALAVMGGYDIKSDNWDPIPAEPEEGPLTGKSVCVTGTLSVPRTEIHALIEAAGGTVVSSVSKKTNILVAGDKAGSKMKKAADLGVEVWSESDLRGVLS